MTREDRTKAVLTGGKVDRPPCSVWMYLSKVDQDPRLLVEEMVSQDKKYDSDSIKIMPFGTYSTQDWRAKIKIYYDCYKEPVTIKPGIRKLGDYGMIRSLAAAHKAWGKTLQVTRHLSRIVPKHTPYLQATFNPAVTLKKLTNNRPMQDMVEHPKEMRKALRAITDATISLVQANTEAGVGGFLFAIQAVTYDFMTDVLYAEFCKPYSLEVINSYKNKAWFNVVHIHGSNVMYDTVNKYPRNCINWHNRDTRLDMRTTGEIVKKAFLGGVQEVPNIISGVLNYDSFSRRSTPQQVIGHIKQATAVVDGEGLITGPGYMRDPRTPEGNLHTVRKAAGF